MADYNNLYKLQPNDIKEELVDIFFHCKLINVKYLLLENIFCKNTEYLSNVIVRGDPKTKERENWFFHYFIPLNSFNENYLLIGFLDEIPENLILELKPNKIYSDLNIILDTLCSNINWPEEDLNHHTLLWKDQQLVGFYLDLVICGVVTFLLPHWCKPLYLKNSNIDWGDIIFSKALWYQNVYLKTNNLEDNLENKINFILNYDLN